MPMGKRTREASQRQERAVEEMGRSSLDLCEISRTSVASG